VKKWRAENKEKIAVSYLPSYSPELNRDELLNVDLKQRVTKAAPPRTKMALTRTAIDALRNIQKQPARRELRASVRTPTGVSATGARRT
jgi:hypothetical protein